MDGRAGSTTFFKPFFQRQNLLNIGMEGKTGKMGENLAIAPQDSQNWPIQLLRSLLGKMGMQECASEDCGSEEGIWRRENSSEV